MKSNKTISIPKTLYHAPNVTPTPQFVQYSTETGRVTSTNPYYINGRGTAYTDMSDKEVLIQIALGTFKPEFLYGIGQSSNNAEVIAVASEALVKILVHPKADMPGVNRKIVGDNMWGGPDIYDVIKIFIKNTHTPEQFKTYLIVASQILELNTQAQRVPEASHYYNACKKLLLEDLAQRRLEIFGEK